MTFDMIKALVDAFDGPGDSHLGGSSNYPLKDVLCSTESSSFFSTLWSGAPPTVLTLRDLCSSTQLWNGMRNSPARLSDQAPYRHSSGRRAEAIMSAIGAIDWYHSEGAAEIPATYGLMFGRYPFAFILEVRKKLGGMFFLSGTLNWAERDLIWPGTVDLVDQNPPSKTERGTTRGTMLPFGPVIISPTVSFG